MLKGSLLRRIYSPVWRACVPFDVMNTCPFCRGFPFKAFDNIIQNFSIRIVAVFFWLLVTEQVVAKIFFGYPDICIEALPAYLDYSTLAIFVSCCVASRPFCL